MSLTFVNPHDAPRTLNVLLYAHGKQGKTTAALSAPGPVLHLNAEGPNAVLFARHKYGDEKVHEVAVTGMSDMHEALLRLRAKPPEKTVVLDTVGSIYGVLLEERAKGGKPTLPQYGDITSAIERWVREVRDLPVNMILLAHAISIKDDSTGVIERLPFTGTSNPTLGEKLMAWVDVIGYCGRAQTDEGPKYMATLVDANGRRGGDRTDTLGTARVLDLTEWIATAARKDLSASDEADNTGSDHERRVDNGRKSPAEHGVQRAAA